MCRRAAPGQGHIKGWATLAQRCAKALVHPHRSQRCGEHGDMRMRASSATVGVYEAFNIHTGDPHVREIGSMPTGRVRNRHQRRRARNHFPPGSLADLGKSSPKNTRHSVRALNRSSSGTDRVLSRGHSDSGKIRRSTKTTPELRSPRFIQDPLFAAANNQAGFPRASLPRLILFPAQSPCQRWLSCAHRLAAEDSQQMSRLS